MEDKQILIQHIVSDISLQADGLDEPRRRKFLEWLKSHSSIVKASIQKSLEVDGAVWIAYDFHAYLKSGLTLWLESLSLRSLFWEYRLILDEIKWWRDLEQDSLAATRISERLD